jgi:DNA replication protein DnaC
MRSKAEVQEFEASNYCEVIQDCPKCKGQEPDCVCRVRHNVITRAFEACVPRDFWFSKASDITHNAEIFKGVVAPYCRQIKRARIKGYGLAFLGDNGVGKTMFLGYVLMVALRRGFTVYYTTLPKLDWDIKRSFNDRMLAARLKWMLTSDFLAVDEMGKEKFKAGDSYMRMQVERILKERFDESMPTLVATNADAQGLESVYGTTLTSILLGKYKLVTMEPGDYRGRLGAKMESEMGYNK